MGSVNKETGRCADKKIGLWTGEYWTVLGVCQGGGIKRQASVGDGLETLGAETEETGVPVEVPETEMLATLRTLCSACGNAE